jgi:DNA-binding transcriptional MerR regulator
VGASYPASVDPDLLSIGQLARLSGLTVKALRYYDRTGLLKPAVVHEVTGSRSYRREQLAAARRISVLRSVDLPLDDVRRCLADPASEQSVLEAHLRRLESRHARLTGDLHRLRHLLDPQREAHVPNDAAAAIDADAERALAVRLFNATWDLMEKEDRSTDDDDRMLHMAHASRYHWGEIGKPENRARGEWQCSRVYAVLGRPEPCRHHAQRCLDICEEHGIGDWDIAFAHEALARAAAIAGEAEEARTLTEQALRLAEEIAEEEDRKIVLSDLETIPGQPRFW